LSTAEAELIIRDEELPIGEISIGLVKLRLKQYPNTVK
jgi:hypothetical protein